MTPALGVGQEALGDYFEVECHGEITPALLARANGVLPAGLQLYAASHRPLAAPTLAKDLHALRFFIADGAGAGGWPAVPPLPGVLDWEGRGEVLVVTLATRLASVSPAGLQDVLAILREAGHGPSWRIGRKALLVEPVQ